MTIHDGHGRVRAFVENKFWAGLTDAQPVSCLGDLPEGLPAALLFIVPQQRVATVWNELKLRCCRDGLEWEDGPGTCTVIWSRVGRKTLLITSWTHVLEGLLDAAHAGEHDSIRQDILQLRGLTNRMDAEAFLPIRADEVTDQKNDPDCGHVAGEMSTLRNSLPEIIPRLVYVALRTPPMPERLLKLRLA